LEQTKRIGSQTWDFGGGASNLSLLWITCWEVLHVFSVIFFSSCCGDRVSCYVWVAHMESKRE